MISMMKGYGTSVGSRAVIAGIFEFVGAIGTVYIF